VQVHLHASCVLACAFKLHSICIQAVISLQIRVDCSHACTQAAVERAAKLLGRLAYNRAIKDSVRGAHGIGALLKLLSAERGGPQLDARLAETAVVALTVLAVNNELNQDAIRCGEQGSTPCTDGRSGGVWCTPPRHSCLPGWWDACPALWVCVRCLCQMSVPNVPEVRTCSEVGCSDRGGATYMKNRYLLHASLQA
jgi:hypothetical protein